MIEEVYEPKVEHTPEDQRKDGISAFLRVRNGEEFLKISINSIINDINELICVVNRSTDKTLNILEQIQSEFPDKVKIYDYKPDVFPQGSKEYESSSCDSCHNLAYYYNFALSKTTYQYVFKFDDDEIFFPLLIQNFYKYCKLHKQCSVGMRGINILDFQENLYVNKKFTYTGGMDTLFFKYNPSCVFVKNKKAELFKSNLKNCRLVDCFYHLKFCKSDRGQNNYDVHINPSSPYLKIGKNFLNNMKHDLVSIEEFIEEKKIKNYPNPFNLGFKFINKSIKKYNCSVFQEIEDKEQM